MSISATEKTGKLFTWSTLLRDHTRFVTILPNYLTAYVVPGYSLAPITIEMVMLTMNSYNTCPYCTGLHGQLARMAGFDKPDENDPAVIYAKTFAIEAGRGPDVEASFVKLADGLGYAKARSVQALCWALLWGKTTGNTINNARDKILSLKLTSLTTMDVFILAYYGPLFLVIGILNKILSFMPNIPKIVSAGLGAFLWLPQAINIAPLGLVSIIFNFGVK